LCAVPSRIREAMRNVSVITIGRQGTTAL
jgi:hypothetical protein